eukprot:653083-Pyramimonas_sp.AAC.1
MSESSQSARIVDICRYGWHRSVAVRYGTQQFLKQYDIEYSSSRLRRHEWPQRVCNGERGDCCRASDWGREMARSATEKMVSRFIDSFEQFRAPPPPVPEPSAERRPRDAAELARREEKRSRASSSVVDGVDDNDAATVICEHIRTIWRERLGADYIEADCK